MPAANPEMAALTVVVGSVATMVAGDAVVDVHPVRSEAVPTQKVTEVTASPRGLTEPPRVTVVSVIDEAAPVVTCGAVAAARN